MKRKKLKGFTLIELGGCGGIQHSRHITVRKKDNAVAVKTNGKGGLFLVKWLGTGVKISVIYAAKEFIRRAAFHVNVHDNIHTSVGDNNRMLGLKAVPRQVAICPPEATDIWL